MYWPIGAPKCFAHHITSAVRQNGGITDLPAAAVISERLASPAQAESLAGKKNDSESHGSVRSGIEYTTATTPLLVEEPAQTEIDRIIGLRVSRAGHVFATITPVALSIWQTRPTAVLGTVIRSSRSLKSYGPNVNLLLRPDADTVVLQTELGFLITYSIVIHPEHRAYSWHFQDGDKRQTRRRSTDGYVPQEHNTIVNHGAIASGALLKFRMVIKLDAGIAKALALDQELIVVTRSPPAVQCIRWSPGRDGTQTTTELLSRMDWLSEGCTLQEIVYDRPMNLFAFVTSNGEAYAAQRLQATGNDSERQRHLFKGHRFHKPRSEDEFTVKAAINSRFSLVALGCADGSICLYAVRDYAGGITMFRRLEAATFPDPSGPLTCLLYSPDGFCLFAGYESGWIVYSVYGQRGASSFLAQEVLTLQTADEWLLGTSDAVWIGGGSELIILEQNLGRLWIMEFARSAATGCFTASNVSKALLQTSTGFMVYRGHQVPDILTIAADVSLWHHIRVPSSYMAEQWPLRAAVVSPDGRYLAIAGQRGLAHYSFSSTRWKQFEDIEERNSFFVRGGMCWHHHILVAAVEFNGNHELRVHSREAPLSVARLLQTLKLDAPAVHLSPSGDDSILVYTYDNILNHFVISASKKSVELVKVGQIALNGIIRAPPRVRGVSWVIPEDQLKNGESAQDVVSASVFFLVDGKLVLLQPSTSDDGGLKYDMKVIANHVEYYMLARDVSLSDFWHDHETSVLLGNGEDDFEIGRNLDDSLWLFDGEKIKIWPDVSDLLNTAATEMSRDIQAPICIPVDFYPLSALLQRGILFGVEAELIQRRDGTFSSFRATARTTLYLPQVLQYYLVKMDFPRALAIAEQYQKLPYFAHALEILLHNVLDEEVELSPLPERAQLPMVLSFLSTFPEYLDIIVQCARKTELRSWRTLFEYLPPPIELFEISLEKGALKTAGGYLLVLHNLEDVASTSPQVIRLLRSAKNAQDWDLCKELARFLMALDESGDTLRQALELVDLASPLGIEPTTSTLNQRTLNGALDHEHQPKGG